MSISIVCIYAYPCMFAVVTSQITFMSLTTFQLVKITSVYCCQQCTGLTISSACNLLPNLLAQIARFRFCKNFALAKLSILLALRLPVMDTPLIMNHFYVWSVIVIAVAHIWAVAHTACQ